MTKEKGNYDFNNYEQDTLTRPRDKAWSNWAIFEKTGDKVQDYIRDAFYRPAEGQYKEQRGITLEQTDGTLINVRIKRLPFILAKTNNLRLGDPLTVVFAREIPSATKGFNATKELDFFGTNLPENEGNKTVKELDDEDRIAGGSSAPEDEVVEGEPEGIEAF